MPNSKFNAESFFESKLSSGDLRSNGSVIGFYVKDIEFTKKIPPKGIKRINRDVINFKDFEIINKLHKEYLQELRANHKGNSFENILFNSELTGAEIEIDNKKGIVVEERKNSILVIFKDNKIKLYPKNVWNFTLDFENIKYLFFPQKLKKNRFLK